MNWLTLIIIGAVLIIAILAWKNLKDEKKVVQDLKDDYPKSKDEEGDVEVEDVPK